MRVDRSQVLLPPLLLLLLICVPDEDDSSLEPSAAIDRSVVVEAERRGEDADGATRGEHEKDMTGQAASSCAIESDTSNARQDNLVFKLIIISIGEVGSERTATSSNSKSGVFSFSLSID